MEDCETLNGWQPLVGVSELPDWFAFRFVLDIYPPHPETVAQIIKTELPLAKGFIRRGQKEFRGIGEKKDIAIATLDNLSARLCRLGYENRVEIRRKDYERTEQSGGEQGARSGQDNGLANGVGVGGSERGDSVGSVSGLLGRPLAPVGKGGPYDHLFPSPTRPYSEEEIQEKGSGAEPRPEPKVNIKYTDGAGNVIGLVQFPAEGPLVSAVAEVLTAAHGFQVYINPDTDDEPKNPEVERIPISNFIFLPQAFRSFAIRAPYPLSGKEQGGLAHIVATSLPQPYNWSWHLDTPYLQVFECNNGEFDGNEWGAYLNLINGGLARTGVEYILEIEVS